MTTQKELLEQAEREQQAERMKQAREEAHAAWVRDTLNLHHSAAVRSNDADTRRVTVKPMDDELADLLDALGRTGRKLKIQRIMRMPSDAGILALAIDSESEELLRDLRSELSSVEHRLSKLQQAIKMTQNWRSGAVLHN